MNYLVFGAGAIGTYIGGSLALRGHHTVFLERPGVAEQLRTQGLRLEVEGSEQHLPAPVIADSFEKALAEHPVDIVLFALKSFDTVPAVQAMARVGTSLPPVLCLQNGVDNESVLAEIVGEPDVIAGTITSAIGRRGLGDIVVERRRGIGLAANHRLSSTLAEALAEAGLNPRLYHNPRAMKWSKLLTNLLTNATSAILDMTPGEVMSHPGLFRLEVRQIREALSTMATLDLPVIDLPETPVRALAFVARNLPLLLAKPLLSRAIGSGRGGKMPSLHIDLHSGRGKSEVPYLNGAVARHGASMGISTPVNARLTEILLELTRDARRISTYAKQPDLLLDNFYKLSQK